MKAISGKIKGVFYGLGSLILLLLLFEPLIYLLKKHVAAQEQQVAADLAQEMTISFERELSSLIYLNSGIEAYLNVHKNKLDSSEIQLLLAQLQSEKIDHIRNLAIAVNTVITYIYPVEGNRAAIGRDYRHLSDQWPKVEQAITTGKIVMDGPLNLVQGGVGLIFRKPVFIDSAYWGILSTVIDVESLMESTFGHLPVRNFKVAVGIHRDDGALECLYGDSSIFNNQSTLKHETKVFESSWMYAIEPAKNIDQSSEIIGFSWIGRLLILLLSLAAGYFYTIRSRSIEIGKKYQLFFEAVEQSPVNILITDLKGNIEYANPIHLQTTGYSPAFLEGKNSRIFKSRETKAEIHHDLWSTLAKGEKWQGIFHNQRKDGSLFWEQAIIFPILNEQGEALKYIAIKEDITEKLKTDEALKQLNADKDRFISILAHDLRSPFNGLLGIIDLLNDHFDTYPIEKQKEMIANLNRAAVSIYNLLDDLLIWSKAQSGQLASNPQLIDLAPLISEVLSLFENTAAGKSIQLISNNEDECMAYIDQYFFTTVLRNLLANAIKFTPMGGRVKVSIEEKARDLQIRISDTGVGIKKSRISTLWDKYSPYTTRGTNGESGTGLGLQLCHEMVTSWGGNIGVESIEGEGSTFYFTIAHRAEHSGRNKMNKA